MPFLYHHHHRHHCFHRRTSFMIIDKVGRDGSQSNHISGKSLGEIFKEKCFLISFSTLFLCLQGSRVNVLLIIILFTLSLFYELHPITGELTLNIIGKFILKIYYTYYTTTYGLSRCKDNKYRRLYSAGQWNLLRYLKRM